MHRPQTQPASSLRLAAARWPSRTLGLATLLLGLLAASGVRAAVNIPKSMAIPLEGSPYAWSDAYGNAPVLPIPVSMLAGWAQAVYTCNFSRTDLSITPSSAKPTPCDGQTGRRPYFNPKPIIRDITTWDGTRSLASAAAGSAMVRQFLDDGTYYLAVTTSTFHLQKTKVYRVYISHQLDAARACPCEPGSQSQMLSAAEAALKLSSYTSPEGWNYQLAPHQDVGGGFKTVSTDLLAPFFTLRFAPPQQSASLIGWTLDWLLNNGKPEATLSQGFRAEMNTPIPFNSLRRRFTLAGVDRSGADQYLVMSRAFESRKEQAAFDKAHPTVGTRRAPGNIPAPLCKMHIRSGLLMGTHQAGRGGWVRGDNADYDCDTFVMDANGLGVCMLWNQSKRAYQATRLVQNSQFLFRRVTVGETNASFRSDAHATVFGATLTDPEWLHNLSQDGSSKTCDGQADNCKALPGKFRTYLAP